MILILYNNTYHFRRKQTEHRNLSLITVSHSIPFIELIQAL